MAKLVLDGLVKLELLSPEFLLIRRALAGQLKLDDRARAKHLHDRLCKQFNAAMNQKMDLIVASNHGVGKSRIAKKAAKKAGLKVKKIKLKKLTEDDLSGYPT